MSLLDEFIYFESEIDFLLLFILAIIFPFPVHKGTEAVDVFSQFCQGMFNFFCQLLGSIDLDKLNDLLGKFGQLATPSGFFQASLLIKRFVQGRHIFDDVPEGLNGKLFPNSGHCFVDFLQIGLYFPLLQLGIHFSHLYSPFIALFLQGFFF